MPLRGHRAVPLTALAALAVSAGCGDERGAPRVTATAVAPTPARTAATPPPVSPRRSHAAGFAVAERAGLALYSVEITGRRFRLVERRGGERAHGVGVPDARSPFGVDLGTGADGRTLATYGRCAFRICRLYVYDPQTHRETRLPIRVRTAAVPLASVDRGVVTYGVARGHHSTVRSIPAEGSRAPRTVFVATREITALDTGPHGLAYVEWDAGDGDGAHESTSLHLRNDRGQRDRLVDRAGYGEEGGSELVSVAFSGRLLIWGVSGEDSSVSNYGEVRRLDLQTGRRATLSAPGGGLFSAAADSADPSSPVLLAYETAPRNDGFGADPANQTVAHFPVSDFG
jgi:hypothetical protein